MMLIYTTTQCFHTKEHVYIKHCFLVFKTPWCIEINHFLKDQDLFHSTSCNFLVVDRLDIQQSCNKDQIHLTETHALSSSWQLILWSLTTKDVLNLKSLAEITVFVTKCWKSINRAHLYYKKKKKKKSTKTPIFHIFYI